MLIEEKLDEETYRFSARIEVDYLNENYKLDIPEGENYGPLSGFIVNHTEEIPQEDEVIRIEQFEFHIIETSNTKIELVELKIIEED